MKTRARPRSESANSASVSNRRSIPTTAAGSDKREDAAEEAHRHPSHVTIERANPYHRTTCTRSPTLNTAENVTRPPSNTNNGQPAIKYIPIPIIPATIDALIDRGFLAPDDKEHDPSIRHAIIEMLNRVWGSGVRQADDDADEQADATTATEAPA